MRYFASIVPLLATSAVAAVIQNVPRATITGNPFSGYQLYTNSYYASEVSASALPSMTGTAKAAASKAAQVPSFFWLYVLPKLKFIQPQSPKIPPGTPQTRFQQ
jgi:cellulose 1,4-beta-cellobiosidase